ncbi:S46 family peptidase [Sphingomonas sp. HF-S3]|uniref:Dipeptidyl-peptidase n=1 Tax=Sphingomonas rustica TaxID=3103142 RepID=A0ABV0B5Z6_9SPHN
MRVSPLVALLAASFLTSPALADEGMWTFDNFPAAKVKAEYGATIDKAWLDKVRAAAVRLSGGCSASVVGARGLVLTNNHCVAECAQDLSSKGNDLYTHGIVAARVEEERKCPGMQGEILEGIDDVTAQVRSAGSGLTGAALIEARTAAIGAIEQKGCAGSPTTLRCQVVDLYHGGQYKLYRYRKYDDVRLVFSPGVPTAFFGGDPDNFNFPRYALDAAFLRLYDGGKPAATPQHLRWNPEAPVADEAVFVAGNPGGTDRQLTVAQLERQRDRTLPLALVRLSELRGRLIQFSGESDEHRRLAQDLLFGIENSYKVYYGRLFALNDAGFMASKRGDEAALRARAGLSDDPWQQIADAQVKADTLNLDYSYIAGGPMESSLFDYARALVRAGAERAKPSGKRMSGYADSQLALLEKELLDPTPVSPEMERLVLAFWLSKAREYLGADGARTRVLLGKDSPETLAAALAGSRLGDPAYRKHLWDGGAAAISASDDPMIRFVRRIDPEARRLQSAWNEAVTGPTVAAGEQIAQARFKAYGDSLYPDATFTLRLSFGRIDGWNERGKTVPPFTYFGGLYDRATGQDPFKLDPRWIAAKDRLNPKTVFNISTTNDIIGGNSGSPLINAKGEVIGAVFDGNIHSLGGDYGYDAATNRAVSVSAAAVSEALRKVYGATALADELGA